MAFQVPLDPREERRARNVGWAMTILSVILVGLLAYLAYAAWVGSDRLVNPESSHVCRLPSAYGWAYQAINYDQASDATLAAEPDPDNCTAVGQAAGTDLVASDGTRLAGWYIPAVAPIGSAGATVILVHGHASNKNALLPLAEVLHADYNLVLFDLRNHGQSFGTQTTGGVREQLDLEAIVAWLAATYAPPRVAVLGSSMGGIAATSAVASGLPVQALILDSTPAGVASATELEIAEMGYPLALPASWAVMLGALFRTGVDVTAADPEVTINNLGAVPVLILQGSADRFLEADAAERLAAVARESGAQVEVQSCAGADHSRIEDVCPDEYRTWVLGFLARSLGT
jgi:pimeloyl-ACP methyl ester carboxylesterase